MIVKLLSEHHLEFLSVKEAAQANLSLRLSNATLLEITCHGSIMDLGSIIRAINCWVGSSCEGFFFCLLSFFRFVVFFLFSRTHNELFFFIFFSIFFFLDRGTFVRVFTVN